MLHIAICQISGNPSWTASGNILVVRIFDLVAPKSWCSLRCVGADWVFLSAEMADNFNFPIKVEKLDEFFRDLRSFLGKVSLKPLNK